MRWGLALAIALGPAVAGAQQLSVELPAWCTEDVREPRAWGIEVRAFTDLDEVEVNGIQLQRRGADHFAGLIDLVSQLPADRPLIDPVGDLKLRIVAGGRRGVAVRESTCRIQRSVLELLETRLPSLPGQPQPWAAPYRGDADEHPALVVMSRESYLRRGGQPVSPSGDRFTMKLGEVELIIVETITRRILGVCPVCQIDATATANEKFPCRRVQQVTTARVHEARTGRLVQVKSLAGPVPPACHKGMTFKDALGSAPDFAELTP